MKNPFEDRLAAALFRITCPDAIELGEYHLGMMAGRQAEEIAHHLQTCPHCKRELAQLAHYLDQVSPDLDYTLAERIKIWIAERIPDTTSSEAALSPAFAVRGGENGPLMFEAGDAQLTIEIQDDPEKPGQKSILGLVLGSDEPALQAHLWQEGLLVKTVNVDELGNFTIMGLAPGLYDLILSGASFEIHVQALQI
jgi:hypothetical protein